MLSLSYCFNAVKSYLPFTLVRLPLRQPEITNKTKFLGYILWLCFCLCMLDCIKTLILILYLWCNESNVCLHVRHKPRAPWDQNPPSKTNLLLFQWNIFLFSSTFFIFRSFFYINWNLQQSNTLNNLFVIFYTLCNIWLCSDTVFFKLIIVKTGKTEHILRWRI